MRQFTKGPWSAETVKTSCGVCHRVGPFPAPEWTNRQESHACIYDDYPPSGGSPELVANAHLIAAAPEMYELMKLVHDSFGGGRIITFSDEDIETFATVLAKAEGRS